MPELGGFDVYSTGAGVVVEKARESLWHGLFLVPFVLACPLMTAVAWTVAGALVLVPAGPSPDAPSPLLRFALAVMFLLGGGLCLWILWALLRILLPGRKVIQWAGDEFTCDHYLAGVRTWRTRVDRAATVVVRVWESRGDWVACQYLRDRNGRGCALTLPTVVGASKREAETGGLAFARRVADTLQIECTLESPRRKRR